MSTGKITLTNKALYIIVAGVIIVAFLLLGGGPWVRDMMHRSRSTGMAYLNWVQILISLAIGFVAGILVSRRK